MITVAQLGLGRFGIKRYQAWLDAGATVKAYDPVAPPGIDVCRSHEEALDGADIICVSTPPGQMTWAASLLEGNERLVIFEKPGGCTGKEALSNLAGVPNSVIAYTSLYDEGVQALIKIRASCKELRYPLRTLRYQWSCRNDVSLVADLLIHDLALAWHMDKDFAQNMFYVDKIPHGVAVSVPGSYIEMRVGLRRPQRSYVRIEFFDTSTWSIVPGHFAIGMNEELVPRSQKSPLLRECEELLGLPGELVVPQEWRDRDKAVLTALAKIEEML